MKKLTLLLFFIAIMALIVTGTVTYTLNVPLDYFETTSSSILFNWTPVLTVDETTTSYLYITEGGDESNFILNQTVDCINSTSDKYTNAVVIGSTTATWDTLTNYTLNITYTNNTIIENCFVTLTQNESLGITEAMTNITDACNLTATNSSNAINLTTYGTGSDENITFNSVNANATNILGFTTGTTYGLDAIFCNVTVSGFNTGFYKWYVRSLDSQVNASITGSNTESFNTSTNYSLNITYTVNASVENCIVELIQSDTLNVTSVLENITYACNLSGANVSGSVYLTTNGIGEDEYITINSAGSNASGILGLTIGTTYGTSTNSTSDIRWFEIKDATNETFFRWGNVTDDVMWLNRNTGDLNISGSFTGTSAWSNLGSYPAACPTGTAVTTLDDSITCTEFALMDAVNTGNLNISGNFTGNQYYGGLWNRTTGGFVTINLVTPDVYVPITSLNADMLNGFTSAGGQNITPTVSGTYQAIVSASVDKGAVSEYGIKLFVNGVGKDKCYSHFETSATVGGTPAFNCFISLTAGQNVYVAIDDHTNPVNDPTLTDFNLNLVRVGD